MPASGSAEKAGEGATLAQDSLQVPRRVAGALGACGVKRPVAREDQMGQEDQLIVLDWNEVEEQEGPQGPRTIGQRGPGRLPNERARSVVFEAVCAVALAREAAGPHGLLKAAARTPSVQPRGQDGMEDTRRH